MSGQHYTVFVTTHPLAATSQVAFHAIVVPLLQHPLGWAHQGYTFRVVPDLGQAHPNLITITLTPQRVLDELFPTFAAERLSLCDMTTRQIYLNEGRWLGEYSDNKSQLSLPAYRAYMVQHEVGHALGFGHTTCQAPGTKCPIMVQQTKGTGQCVPYPFPHATTSAPRVK
jgi:hypothetical protein